MFTGLYTALVTPFQTDGQVDYQALEKLIEIQIKANVDGLVILGTTGESPTISLEEHEEILAQALKIANGRTTMIAGTGSNCTRTAIAHSKTAEKVGYNGLLQVNPYYNKPTQAGMLAHFTAIADSVSIPIMLYNIAGRCGVNLETPTLLKLAQHPRIIAVKEASGNLNQIEEVIKQVPQGFTVLSGDDNLTLDLMRMGGHGIVSVLSNALPADMKALVSAASHQDWDQAQEIHQRLEDLFSLCFIEANPQPVKTMLAHEGWCQEIFRLPMVNMQTENKAKVLEAWEKFKQN